MQATQSPARRVIRHTYVPATFTRGERIVFDCLALCGVILVLGFALIGLLSVLDSIHMRPAPMRPFTPLHVRTNCIETGTPKHPTSFADVRCYPLAD